MVQASRQKELSAKANLVWEEPPLHRSPPGCWTGEHSGSLGISSSLTSAFSRLCAFFHPSFQPPICGTLLHCQLLCAPIVLLRDFLLHCSSHTRCNCSERSCLLGCASISFCACLPQLGNHRKIFPCSPGPYISEVTR